MGQGSLLIPPSLGWFMRLSIRGRNRAATRAKGLPITYEKPPSHPSGGGEHQAASPALSAAVGQGGCIGTIIALLGFVSSDLVVCSSRCPPGARL